MKAFIIFRDRVTYAKRCFAALKAAGLYVIVVDHNSTWPAAQNWLVEVETQGARFGTARVMWRGGNAYPWQLWEWGPFRDLMERDPEPYFVTDPDVVPSEDCPANWVTEMTGILDRAPQGVVKVGMGLRTDLVPLSRREGVLAWEKLYWKKEWEPGVWWSNVDTTLAVYRPFGEYPLFAPGPALRTGWPYVAHHLGWYEEEGKLSAELEYYHSGKNDHYAVARMVE